MMQMEEKDQARKPRKKAGSNKVKTRAVKKGKQDVESKPITLTNTEISTIMKEQEKSFQVIQDTEVKERISLKGYVSENVPNVKTEGAISNKVHKRSKKCS